MNRIEIPLNEMNLDDQNYLPSLIGEGLSLGALDLVQAQAIQAGLMDLIIKQCARYNGTDSSSIAEDTAKEVGLGVLYIINYYLKSIGGHNALAALKNASMKEIHTAGRKTVKHQIEIAKSKYLLLKKELAPTGCYTLNATVSPGIQGFFKAYDYEFMPHRNPATIDYPLAIDSRDKAGIEFIEAYIHLLYLENSFIKCYPPGLPDRIMKTYDPLYAHNLTNIFRVLLIHSMFCVLDGLSPFALPKKYSGSFHQKEEELQISLGCLLDALGFNNSPPFLGYALKVLAAGF